MFASFTSILSPAIKEKLGLGPKPGPPPRSVTRSPTSKPITLSGNRTLRPLPTSLQTEVQSPGFSSRLSSYVREESDSTSPGSGHNSPLRSRLGVPRVSLTPRTLPRLTSRNSSKYGRGHHVPVMVRMAPQEPYSPFKRYSSPGDRSERSPRSVHEVEQSNTSSTDPRQVIAVLAELSGKNYLIEKFNSSTR